MTVPQTIQDIEQLIQDKVEESLHFEYKAADALQNTDGKKSEIAKDVSAMANADGGVIIYGISEYTELNKKHLPEKISAINRMACSKEWLENVIHSNISPKIEGLLITPISLENEKEVIYVVEIPKSFTAHQNTRDFKYYRRYNFSAVPMHAHEISDIMNRAKNPEIELYISIVKTTKTKTIEEYGEQTYEDPLGALKRAYKKVTTISYKLEITPYNAGNIFAKYINYFAFIPLDIVEEPNDYKSLDKDYIQIFGDNTIRDIVDYVHNPLGGGYPKYGPSRYDPILPGRFGSTKTIKLVNNSIFDDRYIFWNIYADNARKRESHIKLSDIEMIEKHIEV